MLRNLLFCSLLLGCGATVYSPGGHVGFEIEPNFEIDEAAIAQAFAAQPQMRTQNRVAFYSFDATRLPEMKLPGVGEVYPLPALLVEGRRTLEERRHYYSYRSKPFSIKKLRLLAARAKADLLIIIDNQHRVLSEPNGWMASCFLIIPIFFAPFIDAEIESRLEAYILDVRNGYLYAHVMVDEEEQQEWLTLWSLNFDETLKKQWSLLKKQLTEQLTKLLKEHSGEVLKKKSPPTPPIKPKPKLKSEVPTP